MRQREVLFEMGHGIIFGSLLRETAFKPGSTTFLSRIIKEMPKVSRRASLASRCMGLREIKVPTKCAGETFIYEP